MAQRITNGGQAVKKNELTPGFQKNELTPGFLKETIQDRWVGYEYAKSISTTDGSHSALDGGGEMFCFDLHSKGDGVFMLPFIGMSDEEAIAQYESFRDIACIIRGNH